MTDKPEALQKALADISKRFGNDAVVFGDDREAFTGGAISTGSLLLDRAIGVGGFPRGRLTELWGEESSGKTTLCLSGIANAQKMGLVAAIIDTEHAVDMDYAEMLGVDRAAVMVAQPDSGEQAMEIAYTLAKGGVGFIVIDSAPNLVPDAVLEADMGRSPFGQTARLLSATLPKLKGAVKKANTAMVITNQIRSAIGEWSPTGKPPTKSATGFALKYAADVRIKTARQYEKEKSQFQQLIKAFVNKNKVAPPFRKAEFAINYASGIDIVPELIEVGSADGLIEVKGGGNYYFGGKHYRGKDAFVSALRENEELRKELVSRVR